MNSRILLAVTLMSMAMHLCSAQTTTAKAHGIRVTAICGRGCDTPNGACDVYVLSPEEYRAYQNAESAKLKPIGKTPLVLTNLSFGTYFVGIDVVVDTSVVQLKGFGFPPIHRPDCASFFADDFPKSSDHIVKSSDVKSAEGYRVDFALRKWYAATVEEGRFTPVVALFVEKSPQLSSWEKYYPKEKAVESDRPFEERSKFWVNLSERGYSKSAGSADSRKLLAGLLSKGGRVCLPEPERGVVWIDSYGDLVAHVMIPADRIANPTLSNVSMLMRESGLPSYSGYRTGVPTPQIGSLPVASRQSATPPTEEPSLPRYKRDITRGANEVRIRNPNAYSVRVGLRSNEDGCNFAVDQNGVHSVWVPDGNYEIYFVYSNDPNALYKGDDFVLKGNGVEIQIVKVADGNYGIQKVK